MHAHLRRSPASRRPLGFLAALLACWLLTQALGQAHAVLHLRRPAATPVIAPALQRTATLLSPATPPAAAAAPSAEAPAGAPGPAFAAALGRAFHPRSDPQAVDDGVCRLYAQLAQGDLASGAMPPVAPAAGCIAVVAVVPVGAAAAPRRGTQARGPPGRG